ncbi:hypothetical protein D046_1756B, partial [Vibrio parahaemolyticus V-223/04]
RNGALPH